MAQRVAWRLRRAAVALGLLATPVLRAAARRAVPALAGTADLPGLDAPALVRHDEHGVPHVEAATDADAFRALGFCHGRDRFFQMDMLRRVLRGRLAETVGERPLGALALPPFGEEGTTLHADHLMRALDLLPAARRSWREALPEERHLLRAYVDGVNAAVRTQRRRRPVEHRALGLPLRPWGPVDSLLLAKGMALGLSFKWRSAPVFAALAERLADRPGHLERLLPPVPGPQTPTALRCVADGLAGALRFLPSLALPGGSNAWVVGAGRTAAGMPILAGDPHLELGLPSIWYLASLRGARYAAVGATLPGLPGVVVGRTPTLAWTLTNAMLDDADLWVEEVDERGARHRVDGRWRDLVVETQAIARRGRGPHLVRVRRTHRGPILSDAFPGYEGPPVSIRMVLHENAGDLQAFLGLGCARSVDEALEAARGYGAPAQNLLLADTNGQAAYRMIGRVPVRDLRGHPALLRDGTTTREDWRGWVQDGDLPALGLGPADQFVSANDPKVGPDYPHYLSHLYEPRYRAERIGALLAGRHDLTADDMRRFQRDATNLAVPRLRAALLVPHAEGVRRLRPTLGPLLDRLLAFDGEERADARGALPWHLLHHHLVRRVFEPALGRALRERWTGLVNLVDPALFDAFESASSPWAPPAVRATLLCEALEDTARDLQRRGLDPDAPWGALHTLTLRHPAGGAPGLGALFDRGPYPLDGGPYSVCSGQYLHPRPGPVLVGPSYRQVVDLADPDAATMILCGGQSGHVASPHYDDLTRRWLAGEAVPMRFDPPPGSTRDLVLRPA